MHGVEPAALRGVPARGADREGEADATEDHGPEPVRCLSDPSVTPAVVLEQIEELIDRRLLLLLQVRHLTARGTRVAASP